MMGNRIAIAGTVEALVMGWVAICAASTHTAAVVVVVAAELHVAVPWPTVMIELVVWCLGLPCLTVYDPQYTTHRYLLTKHTGIRAVWSEVNVFAGSGLFGTLSVSDCCYSGVVFSSWNYNQCTIPL